MKLVWKSALALCLPLSAGTASAQQRSLLPLPGAPAAAYAPAPVSSNPYVTLPVSRPASSVVPVSAQEPAEKPAVQEVTPYDDALAAPSEGHCASCGNGGSCGGGSASYGDYGACGCDGGCCGDGGCFGNGGCCGFGCGGCNNTFGNGCAAFGGAAVGYGAFGFPPGCQGWYGSVGGLIMGRDKPNAKYFSADSAVPDNQLMNGRDVVGDWSGGWEVNLGRAFCSGTSMQFSIWQLNGMDDSRSLTNGAGFLNTPIVVDLLPDLNGEQVETYFDGSPEHRLRRNNQVLNLELNALSSPWLSNCCGYAGVRWLAGVRWFRFDESLVFGSVAGAGQQGANSGVFGDNDGHNEAYYDVRVDNNLIGPQVGCMLNYQMFPRMGFYATPKVGLFANDIQHQSQLYTGSGVSGFDIRSHKVDVAAMGSIDLGTTFQLNRCWYLYGGYRLVAVSGIALADNQVPQFLNDTPEIERVDSNGSLLLHGAMMGIGCNF